MKKIEIKKIKIKKKYRKIIAAAAALVLVIVAAGYTVFIAPNLDKEEWVYKELTVERGELAIGVTESGTLEYKATSQIYDLELASGEDDDEDDEDEEEETVKYLKVETVHAAVGQRINEGEAILTFTPDSVAGVRKLLETEKSEAQVALAEAKSEYNLEVLDVEKTYQERLIKAQAAQSELDTAIAEPGWDIQDCQLQITLLYDEITDLAEQWDEVETTRYKSCAEYNDLYETLKETTDNVEYAKLHAKYITAKETYESAVQKQADIKKQIADDYEKIAEYEEKVADVYAKLDLTNLEGQQEYESTVTVGELAESVKNAELDSLMTEVEEAEETLQECTEKLEKFEEFVQDGTVYAGGTGIITEIGYEEGDSLVNSGTIVSYTTAEDMQISVDVSQEDIVNLTVGDTVDIEFSAYEGEQYTGTIISIMTTATSEYAATVSYPVTIKVEGDTSKLYGGMTADVTFVTEKKEDVIYVSKTAVFEENGKSYVYVSGADGEMEAKEVVTGIENSFYIEIADGLTEGDIVYAASKVSSKKANETEEKDAEDTTEQATDSEMQMPEGQNSFMPEGQFPGEMPEMGGRP